MGEVIDIKPSQFKRLNIKLPEHIYNELKGLADESGRTMTEVVRIALGLVSLAIKAEKLGNKVIISHPDNTPCREIVLPK